MLHIRCGDDIREALAAAKLPGDFLRWADPLCQGPTPADVDGTEWHRLRATYNAARYGVPADAALAYLESQDAGLDAAGDQDEIVLWFEHDLFDQTILIRLLDEFSRRAPGETVLSLICIDRHPGVAQFRGLGDLSAANLAALFPARETVTPAQFALAGEAWAAFRGPDPRMIETFLAGNTAALPYLADALTRHLQDFPAAATGLARTQQLILEALGQGAGDPVEIFLAVQDLEPAPWLGDAMFWPWLADLADAPVPALTIDAPPDWPSYAPDLRGVDVRLTRDGHRLFYGEIDWVERNGIDRWLGGVHLAGKAAAWRWDENAGRLVSGRSD